MKRYIILGALLVSAITSHAQIGGAVDSFFHANYNLPNLTQYANRQVGQVSYVLVSRNEYEDVEQRYTNGGYVKLGESRWSSISGIPSRDEAITYARFIGADAVVYAIMTNGHLDAQTGEERSDHTVGFYARPGGTRLSYTQQSGNVDFDSAERRLQNAWDRLPTATKNALRPKEYAFINRNYHLRKTNPMAYLGLINQRAAFIEEGHAEMFPE